MTKEIVRDLTHQEYVVLGLISIAPQSGYSIITYFEQGLYRWSASPGSIYPILKRLEKARLIGGELEMIHETRPRKIYTLTPGGGEVLDEWLRQPPEFPPLSERREITLLKFLFMEGRLKKDEILRWLDNYLESLRIYDYGRRLYHEGTLAALKELDQVSVHRQLVMEASLMELNAHRTWLELARTRIDAEIRHTGEFDAVKDEQ
jgi:DNA-binding PadR family transcriptional regulator